MSPALKEFLEIFVPANPNELPDDRRIRLAVRNFLLSGFAVPVPILIPMMVNYAISPLEAALAPGKTIPELEAMKLYANIGATGLALGIIVSLLIGAWRLNKIIAACSQK